MSLRDEMDVNDWLDPSTHHKCDKDGDYNEYNDILFKEYILWFYNFYGFFPTLLWRNGVNLTLIKRLFGESECVERRKIR